MHPSVSRIRLLLLQTAAHLYTFHHYTEINAEVMQRIRRKAIPIGILIQPKNRAKQRLMLLQKYRLNAHHHRLIRTLIKIIQHKQPDLTLLPCDMQMRSPRDVQMKYSQHTLPAKQILLELKTVGVQFIGKRIHRIRLLMKQQIYHTVIKPVQIWLDFQHSGFQQIADIFLLLLLQIHSHTASPLGLNPGCYLIHMQICVDCLNIIAYRFLTEAEFLT